MTGTIVQVLLFGVIALVFTRMGYRWGKADGRKEGEAAGFKRGYGVSFQQGHSKGMDDARSYTSVYPSAKELSQSANAEEPQAVEAPVESANV